MKRKSTLIITAILTVILLMTLFTACSESRFVSITGIKDFSRLEKIEIVRNKLSDGAVSGAEIKGFSEESDILKIFSIFSSAEFDEDKRLGETNTVRPILSVRFYVKGEDGYLEYRWNNGFYQCEGYSKKTKGQYFRIVNADMIYDHIMAIYFG